MTQDPSTLQNLLTRVEAAGGTDPTIDYDLALFEGWTRHSDIDSPIYRSEINVWWAEPGSTSWSTVANPPKYTASIDAALALVEKLLPEFGTQVGHPIKSVRDYGWYASVFRERKPGETGWWPGHYSGNTDEEGHHIRYYPTAPLAILAALLKALIAQAGVGP